MDLKELYNKYRDLIPYAIFGVLTTLVNIVVFWVAAHPFHMTVVASTIVAWIVAVVFAYVTNRKWVFHSEAHKKEAIIKEIISFFTCRIATGVVDIVVMYVFVDVLSFNDVIMKTVANILVILLNYVASKMIIFKKNN